MLNLFKKISYLDDFDLHRLVIEFRLTKKQLDKNFYLQKISLLTPGNNLFDSQTNLPSEIAINVLEKIRSHFGMHNWSCKLASQLHASQVEMQNDDSTLVFVKELSAENNLNEFHNDKNHNVTISIHPEIINNPLTMANLFAMELSRCLFYATVDSDLSHNLKPEYNIDLISILMGCGIFRCNTLYQKNKSKADSYYDNKPRGMTLSELIFGLALYTKLNSIPHQSIETYLKLQLHKEYRHALLQTAKIDFA